MLTWRLKTINKAIKLNPNYANAYNHRGEAYRIKNMVDHAVKDYTTAIGLDSKLVAAFNNRGIAYDSKKEFDLAIEDYNKAIELNPALAVAFNNRGNTYRKKRDFTQSKKDLTRAIKLNPSYANAYSNRASVYLDTGEMELSIADYTVAIQLKPDDFNPYYHRGNIYLKELAYDCAVEDYTTVIKLNPKFSRAYFNRGLAFRMRNQLDLAIKDYSTAIILDPNDADTYNNRGVAYLNCRDLDLAIQDFDTAIKLNPEHVAAYVNRGLGYLRKNDVDLAVKNYTTAIGLNDELALSYFNRGVAWLRLRAWEKAKADLIAAKNRGMDLVAAFRSTHRNVAAFERANQVKLPEDIAALLHQGFRNRYPMKEKTITVDEESIGSLDDSPELLNLVKILRDAGTQLGEYIETQPFFGIKTTPTDVFVVDRKTRDKLIAEHPSSEDILKPFLHGQDIRRWHVEPPEQWLIFAYRGIEINAYPAIRNYLEKHRDSLRKRKNTGGWYELQASIDEIERYAGPKLVCPNLYNTQTFAVETDGYFCGSTCYIIPTEETWLCGLLNTRIVEWFYYQVSDQSGPDELHARSGFIKQIPVPDLNAEQKNLIRKIVEYLIYLQNQPTTSGKDLTHAHDFLMLKYFERIINGLVYEFYMPDVLKDGNRDLFKHLMAEQLSEVKEIHGDKMLAFRTLYERLYDKEHPVRVNLFFQDSLRPIRIIEDKW